MHAIPELDNAALIRARLRDLEHHFADDGESVVDTGLSYRHAEPVRVRVRRRGQRYHLDDDAGAVGRTGRTRGWFATIDRVVARDGFNVNRRGVVFVTVGQDRDVAALALRLAESSLAVYLTMLELQDR